MKITLKLLATYRKYLPPGIPGDNIDLEVGANTRAGEVLKKYGVPADGTTVILINGRTPPADEILQEGDVLCAFPIGTGG
jgi:sulfur carrier protein ThiS